MIIAHMTEKEKYFRKNIRKRNRSPDYTGIEGGGLSGEAGLESGTAGVAAGKSLSGRGTSE